MVVEIGESENKYQNEAKGTLYFEKLLSDSPTYITVMITIMLRS